MSDTRAMRFLIMLEEPEAGFAVQVPDLAITTFGENVEAARQAASKAIRINLEALSNVMRDMQGQYSRYLNQKYADRPDLLLAPLLGKRARAKFSKFLRAGPVNWAPRFDAVPLDAAGFREFLRYIENNPVRAKLVKKAVNWEWSSAAAHCAGVDDGGRLCLDQWRHVFGNPAAIAAAWREYLEGPAEEVRRNAARLAARSEERRGGKECA